MTRWVAVAPGRARRPGAGRPAWEPPAPDELDSCPFCEGREDRTPPEVLRLPDGPADQPGWSVRVVPNLYPAFERQEVVIHSPRHVRSLVELTDDEVAHVARAWRARREAVRDGYLFAFVNDGAAAGASLPHSHSQLVWFSEAPPSAAEAGAADDEPLLIETRDGLSLGCQRESWAPYQMLVANTGEERVWERLEAALALAVEGLRRLHRALGPCPANIWLHEAGRARLEIVPRIGILAGLELGAGVYVNPVPPEEAAEALRAARP